MRDPSSSKGKETEHAEAWLYHQLIQSGIAPVERYLASARIGRGASSRSRPERSPSKDPSERIRRSHQRIASVDGSAGAAMIQKPFPHIIHISSPDVSKQGSIILLELADDDEAIQVAQKL